MTKLLTIPCPGAALNTTSTLPKKMYQLLVIVGASVSVLIVKTAPLVGSYVKVVPSARLNSELAPFLKSTVIVVPSALSGGQVFSVGLQVVNVCAAQSCAATRATVTVEKSAERIMLVDIAIKTSDI